MSDIKLRDGAPVGPEAIAVPLEREHAELAAVAVSMYVRSDVGSSDYGWNVACVRGASTTADSALEDVDRVLRFAAHGRDLTARLVACSKDPREPVLLTDDDLQLLGLSLFRYGNDNFVRALGVLDEELLGSDPEARARLIARQRQSRAIFDILAPLAAGRPDVEWMVWSSGIATRRHLGRIAVADQQ